MTIQKEVKVIISAVDQYGTQFANFNKSAIMIVAAVEAIAVAMVAASIKAGELAIKLGSDIFQSAADFNDAMYNVEAVAQSFGTTGDQINKILDEMTAKFPLTGAQAGEALQLIAQLGYGTEEQLRSMADAANVLQIATGADLETGIMGTLAILNSFNLEADEAQRVVNLLAAASFSSAANISDLGISLKYAAPIASLLGVSVEETVAAIAQLRDRGLEASQTGTTLRMALIQLGKETTDKTEVLKKYGLTYEDVNPQVVGLTGVIEAFNGQMIDGADAAVLFGTRSVAFANIINMGATAFKEYTKSITGTNAAYDAFEKKMQTWTVVQKQVAGDLDRLRNTIGTDLVQAILHAIGTSDEEGIRGLLNYLIETERLSGSWGESFAAPLEEFSRLLNNLIGDNTLVDMENVYNSISMIGYFLSQNLIVLEQFGSMFANLGLSMVDELEDIKTWLTAVNISFGLLLSPITLIHDAFAGLVNAVHGLRYVIELAYNSLGLLFADVMRNGAELMKLIPGMGGWADEILADADKLTSFYNSNIDKAKEMFDTKQMSYWTDDLVRTIDTVQAKINTLEGPSTASWVNEEAVAKGVEDAFKNVIGDLSVEIPELGDEIWHDFYMSLPDIEVDRFLPKQEDVTDRIKEFSQQWTNEDIFQLPPLELDITERGMEGVSLSLDGVIDKWDLTRDTMIYTDETITKLQDKLGIVTEESGKAALELAKIEPPPDLIFDNITGQVHVFAGVAEEAADTVDVLDKSLADMSKREFKIYTAQFEHDLELIRQESKQTHEEVMSNIEWKAKIEIEDIKAAAEVLKKAFEAVGESVTSTAKATSSMFGDLTDLLSSDKWLSSTTENWLKKQVEEQMELQRDALEVQKSLVEAEVRNLDARTNKINDMNKEAMITVDGDGLKPHLEAMMWEVFEAIQIRATEEGLDKLLLGGALTSE